MLNNNLNNLNLLILNNNLNNSHFPRENGSCLSMNYWTFKCKFENFSRKISQNTKISQCKLEKKLKELDSNLNSETNFNIQKYTKCDKDLELIYDRIAEGVKIRSKCQWYEEDEKSTKLFRNLKKKKKKRRSVKSLLKKLEVNGK